MAKYTIKTAHFQDENALNLFILKIQCLREMQKKYEQTQQIQDLEDKNQLEKEIDNTIETLAKGIKAVFL
jgi:hypothetical protein